MIELRIECSSGLLPSSAALEDLVDFMHVWLVIYNRAVDLAPRVRSKGEHLRADHHPGSPAMMSQQQSRGSRTLQAQNAFEIENACVVHCKTQGFIWGQDAGRGPHWRFLHHLVKLLKSIPAHHAFNAEQKQPALNHKAFHGLLRLRQGSEAGGTKK
jgi:hypothetical protein